MGWIYFEGEMEITQDHAKGALLFQKACDGNVAKSCLGLGAAYKKGYGIEKDLTKAKYYLDKACNLGNVDACMSPSRL